MALERGLVNVLARARDARMANMQAKKSVTAKAPETKVAKKIASAKLVKVARPKTVTKNK